MAENDSGYRLGVDLGTTFTAAAVERNGQVQMLSLGLRQPQIPSVLAIRDGETLVGDTAERLAITRPEIVAREFKRRIGDSTAMIVGGTPCTAESLTGRLLAFVLDEAKRVEGQPPDEVVVTHPANWGDFKLDRLRQAMLLAGCEGGTVMSEPVAAARFYASQGRVSDGQRLAVFDFGGGTFDAAIVESTQGELRVTGRPRGLERLGGIDLDQAVLTHVLHLADVDIGDLDDTAANRQAVSRLRQDCREAKENLSSDTATIVPVMLPGVHSEVRITRSEFERMIRGPLVDAITVVRAVIAGAELDPTDVDALLLVGGSSSIPYVAQMIGEQLARPVLTDAHPKHAIAQGAAIPVVELNPAPTSQHPTPDATVTKGPFPEDQSQVPRRDVHEPDGAVWPESTDSFTGWVGLDLDAQPPVASYFDGHQPVVMPIGSTVSEALAVIPRLFPHRQGVVLAHHHGPRLRSRARLGSVPLGRSLCAVLAAGTALVWLGLADVAEGNALVIVPSPGGVTAGVIGHGDGVVEVLSLVSRAGTFLKNDLAEVADAALERAAVVPTLIAAPRDVIDTASVQRLLGRSPIAEVTRPLVAEGLALHGAIMTGEIRQLLTLDSYEDAISVKFANGHQTVLVPGGSTIPCRFAKTIDPRQPWTEPIHILDGVETVHDATLEFARAGEWVLALDVDANAVGHLHFLDPDGVEVLSHHW